MKVVKAHNMTKHAATDKITSGFDDFVSGFDDTVSNVKTDWNGDALQFAFKARGLNFKGALEVTDTDYEIDLTIPFGLRVFEDLVEEKMQEGLDDFLES